MLQISVENQGQRFTTVHDEGPLEFGRSANPSDNLPSARRIQLDDAFTSRHHLRVDPKADNKLVLDNLSSGQPVVLNDGRAVEPGGRMTLPLDRVVSFSVGKTRIDIEVRQGPDQFHTIAPPSVAKTMGVLPDQMNDDTDGEQVAKWFEQLTELLRAAAGTDDFYKKAAEAMVRRIGFDQGSVLMREDGRWIIKSSVPEDQSEINFFLCDKMLEERRTLYDGQEQSDSKASLIKFSMAAASPIYDGSSNDVKGAVYGAKYGTGASGKAVTPLEAQFLQCLAGVVCVGTARAEHQETAIRRRALLTQHFTERIAQEMDRDPQLMDGRERELSVMFADVRRFSTVSSKLTPRETCNLVGDVMECLTDVIREHEGVLVDYVGDGLLAIWNAPHDQPEHANKACAAATQMQFAIEDVDERWEKRIEGPIRIGVGVNTGQALVGNTGTKYKLKYGPLGHSVNLASRVEGATKHFGVPVLITGATQRQLDERFMTRRICEARVVGIETPVELFELQSFTPPDDWRSLKSAYEQGLRLFEQQDWSKCCETLMPMLSAKAQFDSPTLMLMRRALDCLTDPPEHFDTVVNLLHK